MDIGLQHRKILGFQLVQFPSLLLLIQIILNFEFCCYFYLVLVKLFRQGIWIFHTLVFLWLTQYFSWDSSSPVYELLLYRTIVAVSDLMDIFGNILCL